MRLPSCLTQKTLAGWAKLQKCVLKARMPCSPLDLIYSLWSAFALKLAPTRWRYCMFLPACVLQKGIKMLKSYFPRCDRVTTVCRVPTRTKQLSWSTRPGVVHYSWTPRFLVQKRNTLPRSAQPLNFFSVTLYGHYIFHFLCIVTLALVKKRAYFFLVGTQRETSASNPPNRGQVG